MLTNRKKLRNRNKRIKIILISALTVIIFCGTFSYLVWTILLAKVHYISPLPQVLSIDPSVKNDKSVEYLKEKLNSEKIEFLSISSSESSYVIYLKDNREVILSSQKDLNTQISSLQFINVRLKMESRQFSRLDLRYDKPIIVFNEL